MCKKASPIVACVVLMTTVLFGCGKGAQNSNPTYEPQPGICQLLKIDADNNIYYLMDNGFLYKYDGATGDSDKKGSIPAIYVYQANDYLFYTNNNGLYRCDMEGNNTTAIIKEKNIDISYICDSFLIYDIAYKGSNYLEYECEYHILDLNTYSTEVLFSKSKKIWSFYANIDNLLIATSVSDFSKANYNLKLLMYDVDTKEEMNLNDKLESDILCGYINENQFYYLLLGGNSEGIWKVDLDGTNLTKLDFNGIDETLIDRMYVQDNILIFSELTRKKYGGNLYKCNLQTGSTTLLTSGLGRVWSILADGEYYYCFTSLDMSNSKIISGLLN